MISLLTLCAPRILQLAEVLYSIKEITGSEDYLSAYPGLLKLAHVVWTQPSIDAYLKSELHYPLGGAAYCANVNKVLRR